jgi:hypothetical protein
VRAPAQSETSEHHAYALYIDTLKSLRIGLIFPKKTLATARAMNEFDANSIMFEM